MEKIDNIVAPAARLPEEAPASISVVRSLFELAQLARAWNLIEGDSGSPIQHYIWARACAEAFGSANRLHVVAVGPARQPVAIAPLVKPEGLPRLRLLGVKELGEPMDFIYANPSALDQLADTLAAMPLPIWIERAPANSPVVAALQRAYKWHGLVHISPAEGYPWIALDADWTEPEQQFNAGRRSDFRRAARTANKMGTVHYEIRSPAPAELEPLLEDAFNVEAASWKGDQGSAVACDRLRAPFYKRYAAYACDRGILRLCLLRIGGQAAAMQLAVETGGRFWLLKIGYNQKFARCSPGMLLMLHTVRHAAMRGLRSYEFLGALEPWTKMWSQEVRPAISLRAYPLSPPGMATLAADAAKVVWRRLNPNVA
jgi:CelD/BcsL family acetyltransferase involved in cellulose biosynthesis